MDHKEFWEKCGLHYNTPNGGYFWDDSDELVIDFHKGEDGITLDNLFKYADKYLDNVEFDKWDNAIWEVSIDGANGSTVYARDEDPAQALYKAISEVLE